MLWTLLLFGVTMYFLSKTALPKISEALEKRANAIRENIEQSEKTRQEADELLAEYRARLKEAREQADDINARARKAADAAVAEATADGKAKREELVAAARKDIETETRRSLEQIRKEVADLTVLATETLTRKSLSDSDHQKLVEEALAEVDFGALAGDERTSESEAREHEPSGGDRPRVRRRPVRGRQGGRQARRGPRAARRVRRGARRQPRAADLPVQPVLLLGREARRDREGDLRRATTSW